MTRTMTRWTMAGALAAAAVGLGTAEAAPGSNPFEGGYTGSGPVLSGDPWRIDITSTGRVSGSASASFFGLNYRYKLAGTVTDAGAFSYQVDLNVSGHAKGFFRTAGREGAQALAAAGSTIASGNTTLTKNPDGSVTGTDSGGVAIVWQPR